MNVTKPRSIRRTYAEEFKCSLIERLRRTGRIGRRPGAGQWHQRQSATALDARAGHQVSRVVLPTFMPGGVRGDRRFCPDTAPHSLDVPIRLELRKDAAVITVERPAAGLPVGCGCAWLR